MKKLHVIGGGLLIAAVAVLGIWHVKNRDLDALRTAIPDRPDLSAWPEVIRQRIATCETRIASGPAPRQALAELAQLYHANGFAAEAAVCYDVLIESDPNNARCHHVYGQLLAGFGRVNEAAALFTTAVKLEPRYMPARIRLGDALLKQNLNDQAGNVYAEILVLAPGQPYGLLGLGRVHFNAGRWNEARLALEQAAIASDGRLGADLLPTVYERLGDAKASGALRGHGKASGAFSDTPDPWVDELMLECYDPYRVAVAAGAANHGGNRELSLKLLERALALAPESGPIHLQCAMMRLASKEYSRARTHLEAVTRYSPELADGWIHLSILLATVGDRAGSDAMLARGFELCPQSPGLHMERARRLDEANRVEEAIVAYEDTLRLRPSEADPLISIARLHFLVGRQSEATQALRRALDVEPEFPGALALLAHFAIASGNESEARAWMWRARDQPRVARNQYGQLVSEFRQRFSSDP